MVFWSLCMSLLLLTAVLLLRYTHAGVPTAEAHGLAQRLGLSGRRSVILVVGCGNALVLTALGQGPVPQATWSTAAAALLLLGVLRWLGWSAWRDQNA